MAGAVDLSALKAKPESSGASGGGGGGGGVVVTEANFEAEVLQRSMQVPVVVALYSRRSDASIALVGVLDKLAADDGDRWVLAAVDVEANMRIAQAFGVQAIPTVVAVAGGRPLTDFQGVQPEPQLRQWIDAILQAVEGKLEGGAEAGEEEPPSDPRFDAAEQALDAGDYDGAAAAYQTILDAEPANAEAKAALRQVGFLSRVQSVEPEAIAEADADPADIDKQLAAADAQVLNQQPEAAFARLIDAIKRTAGDDRTRLRTRLLELFDLFDPAEQVVVTARRKLATALY